MRHIIGFFFLSAAFSFQASAASWAKIEGEEGASGWSIECGSGAGWQKCARQEPMGCGKDELLPFDPVEPPLFNGTTSFIMAGMPYQNAFPATYNGLPYVTDILSGIFRVDGYISQLTTPVHMKDHVFTKMAPVHPSIYFTSVDDKAVPRVEKTFTDKFGKSFFDVSHIRWKSPSGKTYYPGRLRMLYDLEGLYSGYALTTWYQFELCMVK